VSVAQFLRDQLPGVAIEQQLAGSLDVLRYGHVLKARQLVGVRGAGLSFDGLYYGKKVSSKLKAGEFRQSFSLARNGLISTLPLVPP